MTLKQCPFCGSEDIECEWSWHQATGWRTEWACQCRVCQASGPLTRTKDESIAAWNERANDD